MYGPRRELPFTVIIENPGLRRELSFTVVIENPDPRRELPFTWLWRSIVAMRRSKEKC